ncbi:hypothetical protein Hanom_Chr03g00257751 [Helianthus anomalus]
MVGPYDMHFVTHLVTRRWGLNALESENHMDHSCTFGKSWGTKYVTKCKPHGLSVYY